MRVLSLKSCDTCRKALKQLRAAGHDPEVIDVGEGLAEADRSAVVATFGADALNRASATWRAVPEGDRALPVSDLLARYPKAMKRPMIEADGRWYRGWGEEVRAALIP